MSHRDRTGHLPLLLLSLVLLCAGFGMAAAAQSEGTATIYPADESSSLPVLLANQRIELAGKVNDLFAFAQYSSIQGLVEDNAAIFSQSVDIQGAVLGDLFVFCQTLRIRGEVGGDIYLWAGELILEPGAVVHGNILGGAGVVGIEGRVEGRLEVDAGQVRIDGEVNGGDFHTGSLSIESGALLRGELTYHSGEAARIDPGARVEGDLIFMERMIVTESSPDSTGYGKSKGGIGVFDVLIFIAGTLAIFLLGAVLMALLGRQARRPSAMLDAKPGKTLGIGFVVAVVVPVAALFAMLLILPIPLGIISMMLYAVALVLAFPVVGLWLGARVLALMGRPLTYHYGALAVGIALLALLGLIPYLGFLIKCVALVAGLGAIFLILIESRRSQQASVA